MPKYEIEALERFMVRTWYTVVASTLEAAIEKCEKGEVAYDEVEIEEGNEEWVEVLSTSILKD